MSLTDHRPSTPETPEDAGVARNAEGGPATLVDGAAVPPTEPARAPRAGRMKKLVAAGVLAVAALGGGGYAVVHATSADTVAASTAGGAADGAPAHGQGGPGGGGMGGAPASGTVVSTTDTTLTVEASDGTTTTYTLADDAVVENDGATASLSDLQAGDEVVVMTGQPGATSTDADVASRVLAGTSAEAPQGAPDNG